VRGLEYAERNGSDGKKKEYFDLVDSFSAQDQPSVQSISISTPRLPATRERVTDENKQFFSVLTSLFCSNH
jgi:hypothetical protein